MSVDKDESQDLKQGDVMNANDDREPLLELVKRLSQSGVVFRVGDGDLFVTGDKEQLSPHIIQQLMTQKQDVLAILAQLQEPERFAEQANLKAQRSQLAHQSRREDIAIIAVAGRFPGAANPEILWQRINQGETGIAFHRPFTQANPDQQTFVPAKGVLPQLADFDAAFFQTPPREARLTDPQHRLFMEVAWETLERGGYDATKFAGRIGLFGGMGHNFYLQDHIAAHEPHHLQVILNNTPDNLCTKVAFKLGLTGPAMAIQCGCASSMTAIYLACTSLQAGDCDLALAGGVSLGKLEEQGYTYEPGMLFSHDGFCRAFDLKATGSVPSQGVAMVGLRRLVDAMQDGDPIYAVIKGGALVNDGRRKGSYTAYGKEGVAEAIKRAHQAAGLSPDHIDFVETSSTASPGGDAMELAALAEVFAGRDPHRPVFLGALKSHIGNLDAASGVAALVKTTLSVHHGTIPANLHLGEARATAPMLQPVSQTMRWPSGRPRRAGVTSIGMGGNNVHLVLEQAPSNGTVPERPWQLLLWSAKTKTALAQIKSDLKTHVSQSCDRLSDIAFTLHVGRRDFPIRDFCVGRDLSDTLVKLDLPTQPTTLAATDKVPNLTFLFPGLGGLSQKLGRELYLLVPSYRAIVQDCWAHLQASEPRFIQEMTEEDWRLASPRIGEPGLVQVSLFITQYAQAKLLMDWGLKPTALIGEGVGVLVAACLAGVFSLETGLRLVCRRNKLLSHLSKEQISTEESCRNYLEDIEDRDLQRLMEPYQQFLAECVLQPPTLPIFSTCTGQWLSDAQATQTNHWCLQIYEPLKGTAALHKAGLPEGLFLEMGGKGLFTKDLPGPHPGGDPILSRRTETLEPLAGLLTSLGRAWQAGLPIEWDAVHADEALSRVRLPTYPFERKSFWIPASANTVPTEPLTQSKLGSDQNKLQVITQIWESVLEKTSIGLQDDFFECGGSSLQALQVLAKLREHFKIPIGAQLLREHRTIASLAMAMDANHDTDTFFTLLQKGDPGRVPLYLVHPIGGDVFCYRHLVEQLEPSQPVIGLCAESLFGDGKVHTHLGDQAKVYLEKVRQHHAGGPLILGGMSYGGCLAFEMARQWGPEHIPLLILIDAPGPGTMPTQLRSPAEIMHYLLGESLGISKESLKGLEADALVARVIHEAEKQGSKDLLPAGLGQRLLQTWQGHQQAMHSYPFGPYPGRTLYFRALTPSPFHPPNMHHPWFDLVTGSLEMKAVPGDHLTLMEPPNVVILAEALQRGIHAATH